MKNSLQAERLGPYVLAALSATLWWLTDMTLPIADGVLGASLTLGAILTGFLATAKTIVMSAIESPVMLRVKKAGYLPDLISYLKQAIWLSFTFCIVCLVGFFIVNSHHLYGLAWIFTGVSAGAAFIRVTNLLLKIIGS